jgi:hypothetical protein
MDTNGVISWRGDGQFFVSLCILVLDSGLDVVAAVASLAGYSCSIRQLIGALV